MCVVDTTNPRPNLPLLGEGVDWFGSEALFHINAFAASRSYKGAGGGEPADSVVTS
jgi:hypothetical protein